MQITITRPDDWHLHLRDADMLQAVVSSSAQHFSRALIMPNLVPPVVTGAQARAYRNRIVGALSGTGAQTDFTPLMTLYLTESTEAQDVVDSAADGSIMAVKLYPAGATTNSASGVKNVDKVMPVLEAMAQHDVVLCVHGEVTDPAIDIFDREAVFIETVLDPLRQRLPQLRIVMEHITTADGARYVSDSDQNLAASITPHHLMINRNHMLAGGIRPHYYCLPIVKRAIHQEALIQVACSGDPRFFLGTDSAPHTRSAKLSECGCAGVFNAANAMACLATVFEEADALHHLEAFASLNGAKWYGVAPNGGTITLIKSTEAITAELPIAVGDERVVPFDPGRPVFWQVEPAAQSV